MVTWKKLHQAIVFTIVYILVVLLFCTLSVVIVRDPSIVYPAVIVNVFAMGLNSTTYSMNIRCDSIDHISPTLLRNCGSKTFTVYPSSCEWPYFRDVYGHVIMECPTRYVEMHFHNYYALNVNLIALIFSIAIIMIVLFTVASIWSCCCQRKQEEEDNYNELNQINEPL